MINIQTVREFFVGLSTVFAAMYQRATNQDNADWAKLAMTMPSTTRESLHAWLTRWPKIRKWIGERHYKKLQLNGYRLVNEKYEDSITVPVDDFEDEGQLGQYPMMVNQGWGDAVIKFFNENVFNLLRDGTTGLCYDGQPFFSANHPMTTSSGASIVQSNLITGASPAWYLIDNTGGLLPLILQERQKFDFRALTRMDDSAVFDTDEFKFGLKGRFAFGYGFWFRALRAQTDLSVQANFDAAYAQMASFTDEEGQPIGATPRLLVCGMSNRANALNAIETQNRNNSSNYNYKAVDLMIVPWLP
jgi:phage major head subunit gpT-like protein